VRSLPDFVDTFEVQFLVSDAAAIELPICQSSSDRWSIWRDLDAHPWTWRRCQ
jgi:hypothetical protein